jgi:hypothetical protein
MLLGWWPDVFPSFDDLTKWFKDAVVAVFEWLWNWVEPILAPYWDAVVAAMSAIAAAIASAEQHLQILSPYIAYANAWVPVDFAITLIVAYSAFWLALVIYRSVKKWIPTLSG